MQVEIELLPNIKCCPLEQGIQLLTMEYYFHGLHE